MISVKSKPAKRILAAHLEQTETPGITMLEMCSEFGRVFKDVDVVLYNGPEQEKLVKELKAMRDKNAKEAITKSREVLK